MAACDPADQSIGDGGLHETSPEALPPNETTSGAGAEPKPEEPLPEPPPPVDEPEGSSSGDYEEDYGSSGGCDPSFEDCTVPEPISDPYGSCSGVGGGVCPGGSCASHDSDHVWTACTADCVLGDDSTCVAPESGTAVPVCVWDEPFPIPGDTGICLLSCADGETCPAGMECLDSWGGQHCAHPPPAG